MFDKRALVILLILSFIVVLYGAITFQWGLIIFFIYLIVLIILVLFILQKIITHFQVSVETNRQMASDIESLTESVNDIKEDIREIKNLMKNIADK
ncbi:MAG: hypothetical protein PHV39_08630 [Methanomicrobium sp.]|nr:hypothetical protein [Methanomicrobium sp.]